MLLSTESLEVWIKTKNREYHLTGEQGPRNNSGRTFGMVSLGGTNGNYIVSNNERNLFQSDIKIHYPNKLSDHEHRQDDREAWKRVF